MAHYINTFYQKDNKEMNEVFEERIRYHHFKISGTSGGRCTIAYQIDTDRDSEIRNIKYAMTYYSPDDSMPFTRKDGRIKSSGRLKSKNYAEILSMKIETESIVSFFRQVIDKLREIALERTPFFKELNNHVTILSSLSLQKVSSLPDVAMFLHLDTGNVWMKSGTRFDNIDNPENTTISNNDLIIFCNHEFAKSFLDKNNWLKKHFHNLRKHNVL